MMNLTTCKPGGDSSVPEIPAIASFLSEYAAWLLGCGATCIRIEKNSRRIATAFGVGLDISVMPSHVIVAVWRGSESETYVTMRKTVNCGISFDLNAKLSRLSWKISDSNLDLQSAKRIFTSIKDTGPTGKWTILLLTSVANASFCRLFGGDLIAMMTVFISTIIGYRVKQIMLEGKKDTRLTFLCASFFSASISASGHIFEIGSTPEIALGTSVLYLIPGVPYINAVNDLIDRHYLCAFSRFTEAVTLTACLSAGLCIGILLLGLELI